VAPQVIGHFAARNGGTMEKLALSYM